MRFSGGRTRDGLRLRQLMRRSRTEGAEEKSVIELLKKTSTVPVGSTVSRIE